MWELCVPLGWEFLGFVSGGKERGVERAVYGRYWRLY